MAFFAVCYLFDCSFQFHAIANFMHEKEIEQTEKERNITLVID